MGTDRFLLPYHPVVGHADRQSTVTSKPASFGGRDVVLVFFLGQHDSLHIKL